MKTFLYLSLVLNSLYLLVDIPARSQATTNQSTVSNSAAPSASSVTTGGTNINYQTNNAYNNDLSFGGGIVCRTPTIYMGGNMGKSDAYQIDPLQNLHTQNNNYQFNAGLLIPIGSKINKYCAEMAGSISKDRKIASELSMIKACDDLLKKNIRVDPEKYPLLSPCEDYRLMMTNLANMPPSNKRKAKKGLQLPTIKPVTDRAL
jgi:hypothetical protein